MKKLFLIIPLLILTISTITTAESYTSELQSAYDYAYTIGITTQGSIDSANMYGSLIRSHMAKMMVNYGREILSIVPDSSLACDFTDIANESAELKGYIIQACQMGLMGVGITAFNPNAVVTRAQFGTVLSRALYADVYNDGDPYYANHLQALQEAKIMTNISTPSASEVRGYVMLMMMRAGGVVETSTSVCETPENQLYCMIGSSNCPLECQSTDISTLIGTLELSSTTLSAGTTVAGSSYVGSIKFTATDEDIVLKTLSFQKIGSFSKGWIEDDGVKIASIQSVAADTTITVSFAPSLLIKKGTSKTLSVFIEGDASGDQGLTLSNKQSIQSSALSIEGNFPYRLVK